MTNYCGAKNALSFFLRLTPTQQTFFKPCEKNDGEKSTTTPTPTPTTTPTTTHAATQPMNLNLHLAEASLFLSDRAWAFGFDAQAF